MPRTYARKNGIKYNETSIKHALRMVKDGISIRKAARYCDILRESLRRWVTHPTSKHSRGRRPVMTHEEEEQLVVALEMCSSLAWPCGTEEIALMVKSYLDSMEKNNCFQR